MNLLITGGAGFIGSHVLRHFVCNYPKDRIVCIDALTYASNYSEIQDLEAYENYWFEKVNLMDIDGLKRVFQVYEITHVLHLAAESHVDNSIANPFVFAQTNVLGTLNLLEVARMYWEHHLGEHLFYHISTDEVFGSLGTIGKFDEDSPYRPRSPYAASKASSDHFVRAYGETYQLPIIISNCTNNYGPGQHFEKLIPTVIQSIYKREPIPVYGDGMNVRDWLFVSDHVKAIEILLFKGRKGDTYGIGGGEECSNLELVKLIIQITDQKIGNSDGNSLELISFITDRKGHDFRYSMDTSKIFNEFNWRPSTRLDTGLSLTIDYYLNSFN